MSVFGIVVDAHVLDPPAVQVQYPQATAGEVRRLAELLPHPCVVKYTRGYSTQELSRLTERGESAYADPITITHENVIVEGYAIWQLARLQKRATLTCIVRHMDLESALLHLLDKDRGPKGIGDFARILMALELEPWFRERAKSNQRIGGKEKGSTQLTEADRLDVRIEVARAAGVSAGNVSKVKQIIQSAIPEIREALLSDEIRIHRGAEWSRSEKSTQARQLSDFRNEHGIRKTIAVLLRKHQDRHPAMCDGLRDVQRGLRTCYGDPSLSLLLATLRTMIDQIEEMLRPQETSHAA